MIKRKYTLFNKFNSHFAQEILFCSFIIASILFVYLQVANHEFTNYDDNEYVSENRLIQKNLSLETIIKVFIIETAGNWHPITMLSHMLDYHIYGMKPGCHLLTNVLFHPLNTILLFFPIKEYNRIFMEKRIRSNPVCPPSASCRIGCLGLRA